MDVERTIEFILQMQAKAEARMAKVDDRMDKFDKRLEATRKLVETGMKMLVRIAKNQIESKTDFMENRSLKSLCENYREQGSLAEGSEM